MNKFVPTELMVKIRSNSIFYCNHISLFLPHSIFCLALHSFYDAVMLCAAEEANLCSADELSGLYLSQNTIQAYDYSNTYTYCSYWVAANHSAPNQLSSNFPSPFSTFPVISNAPQSAFIWYITSPLNNCLTTSGGTTAPVLPEGPTTFGLIGDPQRAFFCCKSAE